MTDNDFDVQAWLDDFDDVTDGDIEDFQQKLDVEKTSDSEKADNDFSEIDLNALMGVSPEDIVPSKEDAQNAQFMSPERRKALGLGDEKKSALPKSDKISSKKNVSGKSTKGVKKSPKTKPTTAPVAATTPPPTLKNAGGISWIKWIVIVIVGVLVFAAIALAAFMLVSGTGMPQRAVEPTSYPITAVPTRQPEVQPTTVPLGEATQNPEVLRAQEEARVAQQELDNLHTQLAEIEQQKQELETQITDARGDVSTLQSQLTDLENQAVGIQTQIDETNGHIQVLNNSLYGLQQDLTTAQMNSGHAEARFLFSDTINAAMEDRGISIESDYNVFEGLSSEYLSVGDGKILIEEGVTFEYCDMTLVLHYNNETQNVDLQFARIGHEDISRGTDRIRDGQMNVMSVTSLLETHMSEELLDSAGLDRRFDPRTRTFILVEIDANRTFCRQDGAFLEVEGRVSSSNVQGDNEDFVSIFYRYRLASDIEAVDLH